MRINILYSGYVRTLFHCLPITISNIKKTFDNVEINVYGAFWEGSYGRSNRINDPWHFVVDKYQENTNDLEKNAIENKILSLHASIGKASVKFFSILAQQNLYVEGSQMGLSPSHMLGKFYLTKKSFELVNNTEKDSLFLITRPDVVIQNFPSIEEIADNELVLSKYGWYMSEGHNGFENEMMWIASNSKIAENSCDIISALRSEVIPRGNMLSENVYGRYFHLITKKIGKFNFDYRIAR